MSIKQFQRAGEQTIVFKMIKNVIRLGKGVVLIALTLVICVTVINVCLLAQHNHRSMETTFILKEKVVKNGSDTTGADVKTDKEKLKYRLHMRNVGAGSEEPGNLIEDQEIKTVSDNGEQFSQGEKENIVIQDNRNDNRVTMHDDAIDVMIHKLKWRPLTPFFPAQFWNSTLQELTSKLGSAAKKYAKTLAGYKSIKFKDEPLPAWEKVHKNIRQFSLYDLDDANVHQLLHDMATLGLKKAEENKGGTQLKINVKLTDGGWAVMKPMRYPREVEADENRYIFDDIERHIAEIAAFQLDRVLGFYRVPPTIGRLVNITSELKPIAPNAINTTFFTSPAGNICFFGKCDFYCESAFAFCGSPDMIEVSMMSYLPSEDFALRKAWYQPWRRSYSKFRKAYWELKDDLCDTIRNTAPFNNSKLLLDMIDTHTFDFLTGNKDRHSFATFNEWRNYTFPILFDNGRGFGRQTYDAMSILAPLRQCCLIRKSTLVKYIKLYTGHQRLSEVMEEALKADPVAPVLIRGHLEALDRRLIKILLAVAKCLETIPVNDVIISDRF